MADSFLGLFERCQLPFGGRSKDFRMTWRPAGSKLAKLFAAPVDDPQVDIGKPDEPVAGFGFGNADGLADQRLAEKNHGAAPTDLAIAAHLAHGVIGVVPRRLNLIGVGPAARADSGWSAAPGRALHAADCH